MNKKQTGIRLDHDLYQELITLRDRVGVPVAESIRRAIRDYLDKQGDNRNKDSKKESDR